MGEKMQIDVLKTGHGHSTFSFDTEKPEEVQNAKTLIEDMMRLGYTFYVDTAEGQKKVEAFDPKTGTYKVKGKEVKEVPAKDTKPTAVAPSSGGCAALTPLDTALV